MSPHNEEMGQVAVWVIEVGSGLYALTASLVVLGGFVMFLIEMARHVSTKRPGHRKVNIQVNEVHIHVHTTPVDGPIQGLPQHLELPPGEERTAPGDDS
ncbi:MAG: hypothetical protein H0U16_05000 [Actinobacteria bacterium]|nr:hypothetical protein [Actinomycetota bacterium]